MKVLIVEDEAGAREILVEMVGHLGHEVVAVVSAEDGLEYLEVSSGRFFRYIGWKDKTS